MNAIKHKLLNVAILILIGTAYVQAQDLAAEKAIGVFEFETEVLNYGTLKQNDAGTATFTFKNVGNAPIVISEVKTSCGCTLANAPEEAILPGEEAKIEVNYNTKKAGKFSKSITVLSNASEAKKVLKIKGEVLKSSSK